MKIFLSTILLLFSWWTAAQKMPFFEQVAFDYFQKEIYPKEYIKSKIHVSDSLVSYLQTNGNWPVCLKAFTSKDLMGLNASGIRKLYLGKPDSFKKAKAKRKYKIQCYVIESMDMNNGNHIVNVVLNHNYKGDIYHIEMDNSGHVLRWCKGGWIE